MDLVVTAPMRMMNLNSQVQHTSPPKGGRRNFGMEENDPKKDEMMKLTYEPPSYQ